MIKLDQYQQRINLFLHAQLNQAAASDSRLKQAMAYSLLSGGKRIRPALVYCTANSIDCGLDTADYIAAAIEMIHAYSLIHDDLPAMDDDELRRGQATNHIQFDEATAILAGDALQSLAFETLSQIPCAAEISLQLIGLLAQSSGLSGMAGGQSLDLESENKQVSLSELQNIHASKTGALLKACVILTAKTQNLGADHFNLYVEFAEHFGMAFQVIDDILDITQNTETLGKPAHSDTKNNKSTYPSLMGLDQARQTANQHINQAYAALNQLPYPTDELLALAQLVLQRDH